MGGGWWVGCVKSYALNLHASNLTTSTTLLLKCSENTVEVGHEDRQTCRYSLCSLCTACFLLRLSHSLEGEGSRAPMRKPLFRRECFPCDPNTRLGATRPKMEVAPKKTLTNGHRPREQHLQLAHVRDGGQLLPRHKGGMESASRATSSSERTPKFPLHPLVHACGQCELATFTIVAPRTGDDLTRAFHYWFARLLLTVVRTRVGYYIMILIMHTRRTFHTVDRIQTFTVLTAPHLSCHPSPFALKRTAPSPLRRDVVVHLEEDHRNWASREDERTPVNTCCA